MEMDDESILKWLPDQDKFIISTSSLYYHLYRVYMIILTSAQSIVYANYAAFRSDVEYRNLELPFEDHGELFDQKRIDYLNNVQMFFEINYIIYIFMHFFTEY